MGKKRLELVEGKSSKFWEVELVEGATSYVVRWGRIGTAGQEKSKDTGSAAAREKEVERLVSEKKAKGYSEVAAQVAVALAPEATPAPKPALAAPAAEVTAEAAAPPDADDPRRYKHVSMVEALREPERVFHLHLSKPSAFDPVPPEEVAALSRLGELAMLESLSLSFVEAELPALTPLRRLRVLQLSGVGLERVPEGLETLSELEEVSLLDNPRLDLASALRALVQLPGLRTLRLGGRELGQVPENLAELEHVENLILEVTTAGVAKPVARMPGLRRLYLRFAKADGLPELCTELAGTASLRSLNFAGARQLQTLPAELGRLTQLERFGCAFLPLTALPAELSGMAALRVVSIEGGKIKGNDRKKAAALAPKAKLYWSGDAPADMDYGPRLEVRRVADATGLSAFEQLFGRAFPKAVPANPMTPQILPPPEANAFEWLVLHDQSGGPYVHLMPFFLDAVPLEDSLPNGDWVYAHLDRVRPDWVEYYLCLHDEGGPVPLQLIGKAKALDELFRRAESGELPTAKPLEPGGRMAKLLGRSLWLMDLLVTGTTEEPPSVLDDDTLTEQRAEAGFADDPAELLFWLWGAYFSGRDVRLEGLLELARSSKSRVVRDAGKVVQRIHQATSAEERSLGTMRDLAELKRSG